MLFLPIQLRHFGEADAISSACRGFFLPFLQNNIFASVVRCRNQVQYRGAQPSDYSGLPGKHTHTPTHPMQNGASSKNKIKICFTLVENKWKVTMLSKE